MSIKSRAYECELNKLNVQGKTLDLLVNNGHTVQYKTQLTDVCVQCRNSLSESITLKYCDHKFCLGCFNTFCRRLNFYSCYVCQKANHNPKTACYIANSNMNSVDCKVPNMNASVYRKNGYNLPYSANKPTATITTVKGEIQNLSLKKNFQVTNGLIKHTPYKVFQNNTCNSSLVSTVALNKSQTATARATITSCGSVLDPNRSKIMTCNSAHCDMQKTSQLSVKLKNNAVYFEPIDKVSPSRIQHTIKKVTPILHLVKNFIFLPLKINSSSFGKSTNSAFVSLTEFGAKSSVTNSNPNVPINYCIPEFYGFSEKEQSIRNRNQNRKKKRQSLTDNDSLMAQVEEDSPKLNRKKCRLESPKHVKRKPKAKTKPKPAPIVQHHYFLRPKKQTLSYTT